MYYCKYNIFKFIYKVPFSQICNANMIRIILTFL